MQGLLVNVTSKVHINGRFTEEIPLTHRVRQACPLSPLLFALSMQPLMDYLDHKLEEKELEGIKILEELTIYHWLFAESLQTMLGYLSPLMKSVSRSYRKL